MTTKAMIVEEEDAKIAEVRAIEARRAQKAAEDCATMCKPVLDLLASPAWLEVRARLVEIAPGIVTLPRVYSAVESLPRQMDLVSMQLPSEARAMPAAG